MKADVVQHGAMTPESERIGTDEQVLVVREAVHRIAGADAHVASVVMYAHDGRRKFAPRLAIPGSGERRIQLQLVVRDLNPADTRCLKTHGRSWDECRNAA